MAKVPWQVHTFGGTSVAGSERYQHVAKILAAEGQPRQAVVVSAMSGVTNALLELVELAKSRDETYPAKLEALKDRHLQTLQELVDAKSGTPLAARLRQDFAEIGEILRGIWLAKGCSELTAELVSGYGEIWSAQFLKACLAAKGVQATWLDAREVLVVEPGPAAVTIDWTTSQTKTDAWFKKHAPGTLNVVVVTGFIASTPQGTATTLKRNGSDYSASIFGALLKAETITIWTDVDGVLSADPRLVPEAVVLDELSYAEATELAYFGAKVVHPSTMAPAIDKKIPIWIRNTFKPQAKGTLIHSSSAPTPERPVKGFATIDHMALVNVEGTGMIGVPGVAQRLFGALREVGVSVVMISQASSEHSICFAIPAIQAGLAKKTVEAAFFGELHHGHIESVEVVLGCSVLAIVGDNMVEQAGVAGKFFAALGAAGVSVRAIAQGSSERNISAVIAGADATRALRAVHAAFYLSSQTLSIGLVGVGLIGGTLLGQLDRELERLRRDLKIDLRVRGVMTSQKMLLADGQIDLKNWRRDLEAHGVAADLAAFARHIRAEYLPHAVIVDATASGELTRHYPQWFEQGLHVVTPNKKANSGSYADYVNLRRAARRASRHFLYSTNVGAGLPILNTLRDLVQTGDAVTRIEGVFSGTLSFLFNTFGADARAFSAIVADAKARGYTEPDPRDDLSGADVARKLVILARELGIPLELDAIKVQNLVVPAQRAMPVDEWLKKLAENDDAMQRLVDEAHAKGEVLRYVGLVEVGKGSQRAVVELKSYPAGHPFASLNASDNIVAFHTVRYPTQPLVIKGPGAGPEVTAGGVFADLLRLTAYLGGEGC
jgi:aspartokinase/homoserine dehydrogenase 1